MHNWPKEAAQQKILLVLTIYKFLILTHEVVWDCVKAFLGSILLICIIKLNFIHFISSKRCQSLSQIKLIFQLERRKLIPY